jgi:hypothetical protein
MQFIPALFREPAFTKKIFHEFNVNFNLVCRVRGHNLYRPVMRSLYRVAVIDNHQPLSTAYFFYLPGAIIKMFENLVLNCAPFHGRGIAVPGAFFRHYLPVRE